MGLHLIAYVFSLLLMISTIDALPYTCDPATDCSSGVGSGFVPDPENCENYYVCIIVGGESVPSTNPLTCPSGQYFDIEVGSCAAEDVPGTCGSNVCPEPNVTLCTTECPPFTGEITTVANKNNCSTYYVCLSNGPTEVSCPIDAPYFNGVTCVPTSSQCCDFCSPYCSVALTQIVDPCDCSSYYICVAVGVPSEGNKFSCGAGNYYDENTAQCLPGTCSNICSNSACGITGITQTTALTSTTTPPTGTCDPLSSFNCPDREGNYPRCTYCDQSYFHCSLNTASIKNCPDGNVFNTNPDYPYCILPENCPYP